MNDTNMFQMKAFPGFAIDPASIVSFPQNTNTSRDPHLAIIRQSSLALEQLSFNGIQRKVHVVVKNQPFLVQVSLVNGQLSQIDFNRYQLEVRLVYDCENLKEVDFVKLKPMDVKTHINERGDQATFEIRIKVLSSQLEDMFFRLRFVAIDSVTKIRMENLKVFSESIKCVSKPEQIKKKKAPVIPKNVIAEAKKASVSQNNQPKKDFNESISEALMKIENTCLKNNGILQTFAANYQNESNVESGPVDLEVLNSLLLDPSFDISDNSMNSIMSMFTQTNKNVNSNSNSNDNSSKKRKEISEDSKKLKELVIIDNPFDLAFQQFMETYNKLSNEERASKIRSVSKKLSSKDAESFTELLDSYLFESKSIKKHKSSESSNSTCDCDECPHKKELERIDEFWGSMMSAPYPLNSNTIIS